MCLGGAPDSPAVPGQAHRPPCLLIGCVLLAHPRPLRRYKKHAGLDCYPPLQIMFATKTGNRGKLDSHCWFFDGFAYLLQPEICVLFDAGEAGGRPPLRSVRLALRP